MQAGGGKHQNHGGKYEERQRQDSRTINYYWMGAARAVAADRGGSIDSLEKEPSGTAISLVSWWSIVPVGGWAKRGWRATLLLVGSSEAWVTNLTLTTAVGEGSLTRMLERAVSPSQISCCQNSMSLCAHQRVTERAAVATSSVLRQISTIAKAQVKDTLAGTWWRLAREAPASPLPNSLPSGSCRQAHHPQANLSKPRMPMEQGRGALSFGRSFLCCTDLSNRLKEATVLHINTCRCLTFGRNLYFKRIVAVLIDVYDM